MENIPKQDDHKKECSCDGGHCAELDKKIEEMGYEVIYGDTDSAFVNSKNSFAFETSNTFSLNSETFIP